jgi:hypothetical protein
MSTLRSWFVDDEPAAPAPPTAGDLLRQRIEREPSFELGRYVVMGGYSTYQDEEQERPRQMLEALADMREAATSYEGSPYLHPVKVSFLAIDWLEMDYVSPTLGPVHVGIPAILGGRWIANDIPLLIDVAATAVVDAMTPRSEEAMKPALERLARLSHFGKALINALKDESGAHVTLHSPFGPADVRQHDISGGPYAVYRLPDTEDFENLPEGYEFEAWEQGVSIKRCRSMNYGHLDTGEASYEWDRQRFVERALAYFDPTPLPGPNPMPRLRKRALMVRNGRRVLTMRWTGQTTFSLPMIDYVSGGDREASDLFGALVGTKVGDIQYHTGGEALSGSPESPDVNVWILAGTLEGDPIPMDGLCCEIHWLDIDEPDRPVDDSMRHSLLPAIRGQLDRKRS